MSEWKQCKLGDVVFFQRGFDITKMEQKTGNYPVVSSSGVNSYHNEYKVKGPGVVVGRKGTLGTVFFIKDDFWPHDTTLWVKDFYGNDPCFIYYFLHEFDLERYDVGSSNPTLNRNHIHILPAKLPPLPEQRAIASVLASFDDKIALLHRQNKTLEAMAETLFRQWFVEEGNGSPVQISELVDFNPLRSLNRGTIAPYLEMANVNTSVFHPSDWYPREFSSGMKFINGDTLLARITPCLENGKAAFVTFLDEGVVGWGSTEFIVMRSKGNLHPLFTYALAKNRDFRDYAQGCLEGSSGRQRVNVDHLAKYQIVVPRESIISEFNQIMQNLEPKLHTNFLQIRTLEKLRDTMLPKLMSGEVRVEI